jgi:pimeloyl-ACP methyl ester carboxylesterase
VLEAVGVDRATIVGFSIGGGIALELAVTDPDRVERLVLISPVMPDRPFEAEFFENLRRVAAEIRTEGVRAAMLGSWLESPLWNASLGFPGMRERLAEIVADFPGAEYLATERDRVNRDWTIPGRLAEIQAPTLIMTGENDLPGFGEYGREAAASIPGARFEVFENCGHVLPIEASERVVELITEHAL